MSQSKTQTGRQAGSNGVSGNGASGANSTSNGVSADNGAQIEEVLEEAVSAEADRSVDETDRFGAPEGGENVVAAPVAEEVPSPEAIDIDPAETEEWLESLRYVLESKGPQRATYLLAKLNETAHQAGVELPFSATTPYVNTIRSRKTAAVPGQSRNGTPHQKHHPLERDGDGRAGQPRAGRHRRAYLDVRLRRHAVRSGVQSFFQRTRRRLFRRPGLLPRATPRLAFTPEHILEGRLTRRATHQLPPGVAARRRDCRVYPHPWLMPTFWEFPTVSMGLGPIMAIYQARFNKYLEDRGIKDTRQAKSLVLCRRRRMRRAGNAGGDYAGLARESRQFDLRRELQSAATRRPRARQRQDHSGIGSHFPRRWLERDQSHLGRRLGLAFGKGRERFAHQADGRSGRRRISKIRCRSRQLHSRELFRQVSGTCRSWSSTCPTKSLPNCAAAGTIRKRFTPPSKPPSKQPASRQ